MGGDSADSGSSVSKRRYVRGLGALAVAGIGTTTTADGAPDEKRTPEPYPRRGSRAPSADRDVYLNHVAELPATRRRLGAYERSGRADHLFTDDLGRRFDSFSDATVDITVSTRGERNAVVSRGEYGRTIHGWRPTAEEVERLRAFGEVTFAPEVISSKVGLSGVAVDALPKLAALDFVLEIGFDPSIRLSDAGNAATGWPTGPPTADALKTVDHSGFDAVSVSEADLGQIGIIGTGYSGETTWSKRWAKSVGDAPDDEWNGIDAGRATDFFRDDWREGHDHGTKVADALAYILKETEPHSDLLVPLEVYDPETGNANASAARRAIEYALKHDISVCSMSVETKENSPTCTGTLCSELQSYASAGYVVACATGNDELETGVCHPATSYFTVGVGGYGNSCATGYRRHGDSNYGEIRYRDPDSDTTYCPWCASAAGNWSFQPNVYAAYAYRTDAGRTLAGTSFSAPVVAAGAALHHAVRGSAGYGKRLSKYDRMGPKAICPGDASRLGGVLHVPDLV